MTEEIKKEIYNKLVDLLTIHCNTCLDKHQKEKILLCAFKLELIAYAEENAQDDVEGLWEDLARILGVKISELDCICPNKCNCANGVCTLC